LRAEPFSLRLANALCLRGGDEDERQLARLVGKFEDVDAEPGALTAPALVPYRNHVRLTAPSQLLWRLQHHVVQLLDAEAPTYGVLRDGTISLPDVPWFCANWQRE
jgi:hypothetical protein